MKFLIFEINQIKFYSSALKFNPLFQKMSISSHYLTNFPTDLGAKILDFITLEPSDYLKGRTHPAFLNEWVEKKLKNDNTALESYLENKKDEGSKAREKRTDMIPFVLPSEQSLLTNYITLKERLLEIFNTPSFDRSLFLQEFLTEEETLILSKILRTPIPISEIFPELSNEAFNELSVKNLCSFFKSTYPNIDERLAFCLAQLAKKEITLDDLIKKIIDYLPYYIESVKKTLTCLNRAKKINEIVFWKKVAALPGFYDLRPLFESRINPLPNDLSTIEESTLKELTREIYSWLDRHPLILGTVSILDLSNQELSALSDKIKKFKNLEILNVSKNPLHCFPSELNQLENLTEVYAEDCNLRRVPSMPSKVKVFKIFKGNRNFSIVPENYWFSPWKNRTAGDAFKNNLSLRDRVKIIIRSSETASLFIGYSVGFLTNYFFDTVFSLYPDSFNESDPNFSFMHPVELLSFIFSRIQLEDPTLKKFAKSLFFINSLACLPFLKSPAFLRMIVESGNIIFSRALVHKLMGISNFDSRSFAVLTGSLLATRRYFIPIVFSISEIYSVML